jgi:hypothetical protein
MFPAEIPTLLESPTTGTGTAEVVVVPLPSSPKALLPKHRAPPALVRAQVCVKLAEIDIMPLESPVTATGIVEVESTETGIGTVSLIGTFVPQHNTPPVLVRAQVLVFPVAIATTLLGSPVTDTGTLESIVVPLPSWP